MKQRLRMWWRRLTALKVTSTEARNGIEWWPERDADGNIVWRIRSWER